MVNTQSSEEKRIVEQLNFDANTARRASWEAWEFRIVGPFQVEVTNASYGFLSEDHTYTVGIEEREGLAIPAECDCPADDHREQDCKHKVALATIGGPTVLNAALGFASAAADSVGSKPKELASGYRPDGGVVTIGDETKTCPNGHEWCPGTDGESLACFDCFQQSEDR